MNFTTLKSEFADRGFSYLTDTRQGRYINYGRAELDDSDLWPYRLTTQSGASPLTVTDLGTVGYVFDTATNLPLEYRPYEALQESLHDLATGGTPEAYYVTDTQVVAIPVSGDSISVRHWKITPDLTGTETPLAPDRFHKLIVDIAAREAYRDSDNHQAAESLQVQIDRDTWRMREALMIRSTQGPQNFVRVVEGW